MNAQTSNQSAPMKSPAPPPARSTTAPIECTVKKTFYDDKMQLVAEGKTYLYQPSGDEPFPFNILQPIDPALAEKAEKEYSEFRKAKLARIRDRRDRELALKKIARA